MNTATETTIREFQGGTCEIEKLPDEPGRHWVKVRFDAQSGGGCQFEVWEDEMPVLDKDTNPEEHEAARAYRVRETEEVPIKKEGDVGPRKITVKSKMNFFENSPALQGPKHYKQFLGMNVEVALFATHLETRSAGTGQNTKIYSRNFSTVD